MKSKKYHSNFYSFLKESDNDHIILYRAMSDDERNKTLKDNKLSFIKRFKWFSPSISFIFNRVKGVDFNNSRVEKQRYDNILTFKIMKSDLDKFKILNKNEYMLDRRNLQLIKWLDIKEYN